jgi:hypothetical protein
MHPIHLAVSNTKWESAGKEKSSEAAGEATKHKAFPTHPKNNNNINIIITIMLIHLLLIK